VVIIGLFVFKLKTKLIKKSLLPLPLFPFSIINHDFAPISVSFQASGGLRKVRKCKKLNICSINLSPTLCLAIYFVSLCKYKEKIRKQMNKKLIRFDWAMKKLLRNKANFDVLEGFLSELLRFDVQIESILESESNKDDIYDKFNRVDILVKSQNSELMLVEVQNDSEIDYFQRMLYGVSKLVTQYIKEGEPYGTIRKIYSINIVYFGLGQGKDYVYEYKGAFVGLHEHDILMPTPLQKEQYSIERIADIFPKYYLLKVNNFNKVAENTLDEWVYFLKTSQVEDNFKAKGLDKAKEKLAYEILSDIDKKNYDKYQENITIEKSVVYTAKKEREIEIAKNMIKKGFDNETIMELTGLTHEPIDTLRTEGVKKTSYFL
jgi:predicted transposase/invertase (TIGR01784 family)